MGTSMCGFAGILMRNGRSAEREAVEAMTDAVRHRGPDSRGIWCREAVGLGFNRLSIIGLEDGFQPMTSEDGALRLVFNGEIYNHKELRKELEAAGHRFATRSDTEVILHLYEEMGADCVKRLRGMFGFALWDERKAQLLLARDPFGIKPLYYCADTEKLLFASEIKSLLAFPGLPREVDTGSLTHYLSLQYVPQPATMFRGICKLEPGHRLLAYSDGRMDKEAYWQPGFERGEKRALAEMAEELGVRMRDSVDAHMGSDVPVGCLLSGGIDSSAIAALMREKGELTTFSVGFADARGERDETVAAGRMARHIGSRHYEERITAERFFDDAPTAVWHLDEPVGDPSAIALYNVCRLARRHVKVVLSGEGADELFGGYGIYREPRALRPLAWLPPGVKQRANGLLLSLPVSFYGKNYLLRGTTALERRFIGNAHIFRQHELPGLLGHACGELSGQRTVYDLAAEYYEASRHADDVTRMQQLDLNLWMPGNILAKADKMSMAHSLELRVPFLDRSVFELASRIPASYRIAKGTTKYVFRKAMEGILPAETARKPKLGFPVPLREWLRSSWGGKVMETIREAGIGDYIDVNAVERMYRDHREGRADYARKLWVVYVFALWYGHFMRAPR